MSNGEEIIITTVTEKTSFDQMSDKEKAIYRYAYEKGAETVKGDIATRIAVSVLIVFLIITMFIKCPQ